ncbi:MAG: alpha/beta hydrolase [archaeon]|nr:alpha/beta hydrolase [archaeon]
MPTATANGIQIEYETFGDPSAKPLLLIQGLRVQMLAWDEEFCKALVDRGFFVIRFDNRDVGLSTKFDKEKIGKKAKVTKLKLMKSVLAVQRGKKIDAPYTLYDMAKDSIGVLDHLKIDKAHVCGASMGSAIAQVIAYNHKDRILSLCSMMGGTMNPDLPNPSAEAIKVLSTPLPDEKEAYLKEAIRVYGFINGSKYSFDEQKVIDNFSLSYDRMNYPEGGKRQMMATLALGDHRKELATIEVPVLIIHGSADPLIPVENVADLKKCITHAEALVIEGMGHNIPEQVAPQIIDAIVNNAEKA